MSEYIVNDTAFDFDADVVYAKTSDIPKICKNCRFWENRKDLPRPQYQTCFRLGTSEAGRTDVIQGYAEDKMKTTEYFGCTEFKERENG